MLACPPHRGETSATLRGLVPDTSAHPPRTSDDGPHMTAPSAPCDHKTEDAMQSHRKDEGGGSSRAPIRAERSTLGSRTLSPSRNKTIGDRLNLPPNRNKTIRSQDRPPNRETLNDRPTLPTIPQRATDHPKQTVERGDHDSQASPEDGDARIDDEPLHHEAHGTSATVTTTRKPALGPHTARVVERARKRDTIA